MLASAYRLVEGDLMARSVVAAAWCGVAALALAGCAGTDGGTDGGADGGAEAAVAGSFEIRAVSEAARVSELPADAECAQVPLALSESGWICDDATSTAYLVEPASLAAGDVATVSASASGQPGSGAWEVLLTFTATGAKKFEEVTREASGAMPPANTLVVVVDGEVVAAPAVMSPIEGGAATIALNDGEAGAKALAAAIAGPNGAQ
jgi:preprotein translocase subunit SecD